MGVAEKQKKPVGVFPKAKDICFASEANELFFGVVGHVGSGTGFVARKIKEIVAGRDYQSEIIKASDAIRQWAQKNGKDVPPVGGPRLIATTERLQTLGDEMRASTEDYAAVAQGVIDLIRHKRGDWTAKPPVNGQPVEPDKTPRAYIINSIRHPAEVSLLRLVYGDAFCLVGVVCHEEVREQRLIQKYFFDRGDIEKNDAVRQVQELMARDADDKKIKFGQHVADAFWESDFFFDNTADQKAFQEFTANEDLGRLVDIITHREIRRPTIAETGMHLAVSAQIRSACLSKQVGAAIIDRDGNVLAIGANEVPKAGGGVYGESLDERIESDRRCFACGRPHCSSNEEQNDLIQRLRDQFPALAGEADEDVIKKMRKAGLGALLEFARAIHAEMDAITTASRLGVSVKGASMFVTAFPCHYCARHLIAAGIDQVQYIEPYPKSRALALHGDAITSKASGWVAPSAALAKDEKQVTAKPLTDPVALAAKTVGSPNFGLDTNVRKVLFRPFTGVAPRLYQRAFTKDRDLKDDTTGELKIGNPEWGGKWGIRMIPYTVLEASLTAEDVE